MNPYGASKLAAEAAVAYQARTGKIGSVILRAANIVGAVDGRGDDDLSRIIPKTLAVAAGRFGQLHVNGDGTAVREYLHVADFADACVRAIEACEPGTHQVYNVGSGTGTTVRDIIAAAEKTTGRPIAASWDPRRLSRRSSSRTAPAYEQISDETRPVRPGRDHCPMPGRQCDV